MGIGQIILIALAGYGAFKFWKTEERKRQSVANRGVLKPGVSYFDPVVVTQRPQQAQAYNETNACSTMGGAYAPPIGATENMPPTCQEWISIR